MVGARFRSAKALLGAIALVVTATLFGLPGCGPPPEDSGITGEVRMVPVASADATETQRSRPFATQLEVTQQGLLGRLLGTSVTVESGENGKFSVALEPGTYAIRATAEEPFTTSEPVIVEVEPNQFSIVTIEFEASGE